MESSSGKRWIGLLDQASLVLMAVIWIVFALLSPRFLSLQNFGNIVVQSSSTALVAVGMTFVLLTAGVDLSVGAIMFVGAAIAGKCLLTGGSLAVAVVLMLAVGLAGGLVNAFLVTRLAIMPFIVTLSTLYLGRGLALWITETRALNLPESFLKLAGPLADLPIPILSWFAQWAGPLGRVPIPILLLVLVVIAAELVLRCTPFGRQIYATGFSVDAARKAGVNTRAILASVYMISGLCAALGGIVGLAQLGAVSTTFGQQKEFAAIAAAVLGGTSLFGGRGRVFPGTVLGAILIQTVENGLVILNADPYMYPLVTSSIIFLAVLIDSFRSSIVGRLSRRMIRLEPDSRLQPSPVVPTGLTPPNPPAT